MAWTRSLSLFVLVALAPGVPAQAPEVLFDAKVLAPATAAAMVGQQAPLANPLILQHGQNNGVWLIAPFVAQRPNPEPEKSQLKNVVDRTERNKKEERARDYLITLARRVAPEDMAKAADPSIGYANLWGQPVKYRGQIVHIKGKLRIVRRQELPTDLILEEPEIKTLYEGWIYGEGDLYGNNPFCVLFSELPTGIAIGTKLEQQVECDAYFFKILKYQGQDGQHYAPMLIARTVTLPVTAVDESNPLRDVLLPLIVTGTFSVILIGGALLLFFRSGDKAVAARLQQARDAQFVVPAAETPPVESEPAKKENSAN